MWNADLSKVADNIQRELEKLTPVTEASVDMYIESVYVNHVHNTSSVDELPRAPGFKKMRLYIYIYICVSKNSLYMVGFPQKLK